MPNTSDPLFDRYPLTGSVELSTGPAPTPYHIYDGYGALIGGTASAETVRGLLAGEQVVPLLDAAGRAQVAIWLCDFREASLGPHREFQVSVFVTRQPATPLAASPFALLAAMLTRPEMEMLCHGLWNDTAPVVAYNREHLGLPAQPMTGTIDRANDVFQAALANAQGNPLLRAELHQTGRASAGAGWAMLRLLGMGRLRAVSRQPWIGMTVVNPVSDRLPVNARAAAYVHNARNVIRPFDARADSLTLTAPGYAALDFQPAFVQHMTGFHFVYLDPRTE